MKTFFLKFLMFVIGVLFFTLDGNTSTARFECEPIEIIDNSIPQSAIDAFQASFVYEDGYFRGARVDMLRPYLTDAEIVDLVKAEINYPPAIGGVSVWERFKPKPRGCKSNSNWICIIADVDDVRQ